MLIIYHLILFSRFEKDKQAIRAEVDDAKLQADNANKSKVINFQN